MASQNAQLKHFWDTQMEEISDVPIDTAVFKNHQLPLARIKKVRPLDASTPAASVHGLCLTFSKPLSPSTERVTDYEIRRGRPHDQRRGSGAVCQGTHERGSARSFVTIA